MRKTILLQVTGTAAHALYFTLIVCTHQTVAKQKLNNIKRQKISIIQIYNATQQSANSMPHKSHLVSAKLYISKSISLQRYQVQSMCTRVQSAAEVQTKNQSGNGIKCGMNHAKCLPHRGTAAQQKLQLAVVLDNTRWQLCCCGRINAHTTAAQQSPNLPHK